jgi:hypothetical protein
LARYHAHPGDELHRDWEQIGVDIVDDKKVSQAKWDDAEGGDEETPEVAPSISLEGGETQNDQFQGIVPGNAYETGDYGTFSEFVTGGAISEAEVAAGVVGARHEDIAVNANGKNEIQLENTHQGMGEVLKLNEERRYVQAKQVCQGLEKDLGLEKYKKAPVGGRDTRQKGTGGGGESQR